MALTRNPDHRQSFSQADVLFHAMCRQFIITGRVQGVFFRASTRDVAIPLHLNGHAINLPDGSVEVRACGNADAIAELHDWLHRGPSHAEVENVVEIETGCTEPDRFVTG